MRRIELYNNAINSLTSNKLRTFLTILGIVIGISSVITLLNLGQSAQQSITDSFSSFGPNQISVIAGKINSSTPFGIDTSAKFTLNEVDSLINSNFLYINGVATFTNKSVKIQYEGKNFTINSIGIYGDYWKVRSIEVERGREINMIDNQKLSKVVVIGPEIVEKLFSDTNIKTPIGEKIRINGQSFTVIGITKAKGSSGFINVDDYAYIPLKTLQQYLGANNINQMSIQARDAQTVPLAQDEIESKLRVIRGISKGEESNFTIRNSIDALSFINQITSIFTVFLAAIAAISLLVGGIGIMNIMFVTVSERTKEIGLRKSLGATRNDILMQFLTEAVAVTMLGGIIGTILGLIISYVFAVAAGLPFTIYINSILLAVGVSIAIGLIFGIYPAAKAAKLSPIDALRYE